MIYLDHNSTSPLIDEVKAIFREAASAPLNASSIHLYGRNARKMLEEARNKLAVSLGVKLGRGEHKIIFTSGGTESNNLVLDNFKDSYVLFSAIEHASVLELAKTFDKAFQIKVKANGILDLNDLRQKLQDLEGQKVLVSVMLANNETGVIQPIKEVVKLAREFGALVHTDAVQGFGKVDLNIKELDVDFATISGHKIGALVGIGALVVKDGIQINPHIVGGGQERGERSGTENVLGAICFALAAERATKNKELFSKDMLSLRNYLEEEIEKTACGIIIAKDSQRLPNTSLIASKQISSNVQLIQFDLNGIAVSNGSACSSGKVKTSYVLKAMGYEAEIAESVIRVSFGRNNTLGDAKKFVAVWKQIHKKIIN